MFTLDPKLAADSIFVTDLDLCQVRLMDQAAVPWLILVPRREGAAEIHHLPAPDQAALWQETALASSVVERLFAPKKLNTGALGNIVQQLHMHVLGRFETDPAWPGPVWGTLPPCPCDKETLDTRLAALREAFKTHEHATHPANH